MAMDLNAPLRIGQILKPRGGSGFPACRLTKWVSQSKGMTWTMESLAGEEKHEMTLSEIYERFKFEN